MKAFTLNIVFILIAGMSFAQSDIKMKDIKIEDDVILYQEVKQFIITEKMALAEIYVKDLATGEIILTFVRREAPSPEGATKANPDGMDTYYEFTYLKTNAKCDHKSSGFGGKKDFAKDILNYGLIVNGVVNEDNVNKFISIKGSPYTNRNNQTIIIR